MKFAAAATIISFGAAVMAQDLSTLPVCGQTCVANMLSIAQTEFGCPPGDIRCYCTNVNFGYGMRDCSNESCSKEQAATVIQWGTAYCQQALAGGSASGAASALSSAAATATASGASGTHSGTGAHTGAGAGATGTSATGGSPASTPVTTSPLVATITSDGSTFVTTTGFQTIYSPVSGATDASESDKASATGSDASSHTATATGGVSNSATSGSSGSAASGTATSSTSSGAASPIKTTAPMLGAAAMGVLLFL